MIVFMVLIIVALADVFIGFIKVERSIHGKAVGRLLHDKLTLGEDLLKKKVHVDYICHMCGMANEFAEHIFLHCSFTPSNLARHLSYIF